MKPERDVQDKPRAIVIGGSLGGLFAANMLRSVCGWDVEVFEKVEDDLAARGAGIATHPQMFDVLRRIGLAVDESFGVGVPKRVVFDRSGAVAYEAPVRRLMSSWVRFYRPLKERLPAERYRFGMTLERVEQHARGVTAIFADGSRAGADLLVAADGFRSTVRTQLMPEAQPRYAGYVGWRGMVEESDMPEPLRSAIFQGHIHGFPEGEAMTLYPVPGRDDDVREGRRRANFVWYHPVSFEALAAMCTDAEGRCHGAAIAPRLIRPEVIAAMRARARAVFAPQIAAVVDMTEQPFFQAIFDVDSERVVEGRVALLGDAAFVTRPHVGIGTTKAAVDAQYLADALLASRGDVPKALAQYNERCVKFGSRVVARGRWMGAHLEAQVTKRREERTPHELAHLPVDVLVREYASRIDDIPELAALV